MWAWGKDGERKSKKYQAILNNATILDSDGWYKVIQVLPKIINFIAFLKTGRDIHESPLTYL